MENKCKICGSRVSKIFDAQILQKYPADYLQCERCNFIQTEEPHWLPQAYASAITAIDVGLVYRNIQFSNIVPPILDLFSTDKDSYLDYGGGYGMFVRIMRDKGYDFYLHDLYAENVYAKYFELKDYTRKGKFAALTAFEVFEHLVNPMVELEKMFSFSDTILFSTELQPEATFSKPTDWWYFMPETGQHISFYTRKSLEIISQKFKCQVYSNNTNLHLLTKQNLQQDPFLPVSAKKATLISRIKNRLQSQTPTNKVNRTSLLQKDFELYKEHLLKTTKEGSS